MKKITLTLLGAVAMIGLATAQPSPGYGPGNGPMWGGQIQSEPQAKSIEGRLVFVDKIPAIQTKDKTYLIRMPEFFENAYFDGIKEGATIKADGFEFAALPGQDRPWFAVTKATIGGKTYDYTTLGFGQGRMGGRGPWGGPGAMMGGRGGRW
jgi:hypothetical protein